MAFTSETAKRLHERHHKPPPESTFVTAARKSLDRMPPGRARQVAFDSLCDRAPTEADAEWLAGWALEADEAAERAEAEQVEREVAEGLAAAEEAARQAAVQAEATERADRAARELADLAGDDGGDDDD